MRLRFADSDRLARDGGTPVRTESLSPWPIFDDEMVEAVSDVLRSGKVNYWTGQQVRRFEKHFAEFVGSNFGVAVSNGTVAIELALHALGIEAGDEVIVPPRTFIATASAVAVRGAVPIFADIDPVSGNVTADSIAEVITPATRAIIVVHAAGWSCDMDPIMDLARRHGLRVIEDCAQSHGATYNGRHTGTIGDIGAFSFCQDKIVSTGGEGGMIVTDCPDLWERAWSFKDHGKGWDAIQNCNQQRTVFKWLHESIGTNWRMTEMQAAIGQIALRRLPEWVAARRVNAALLDEAFARIPGLQVLTPPEGTKHSYYKHYVMVSPDALSDKWSRDEIVRSIQQEGIPCGSGLCCEIYLEQAIRNASLAPAERLPNARELGDRCIMFVVHPTLSREEIEDTIAATAKVMRVVTAECGQSNTQRSAA
ncbi:MAG: DegT/DnrJ/EryC1/StrS aminotransferase family protein [Planctomycetota bacterium]|nr:DegT/DnrJ/EryC1/StrS aminotransferase family protein [Planctomycetota bacterium]